MAWQVGIVLDEQTNLGALIGWLPLWVWSTPLRAAEVDELRKAWGSFWDPEPALTLINAAIGDDPVEALLAEIPMLELHHWRMTAVRIFGLQSSPALTDGFKAWGYSFATTNHDRGILFTKPLDHLSDVPELELDAAEWKSTDDVYDSFFKAVGAPEWHGRNFNALNDSIATGGINKVEAPYWIDVRNAEAASSEGLRALERFRSFIADLNARGCPVKMR